MSSVGVSRQRDVENHPELYRNYLDLWQDWKSSATKGDLKVIHSKVYINNTDSELACEFINKAKEILGKDILRKIGVSEVVQLNLDGDFNCYK